MIRISEALKNILYNNPFLQFGVKNNLFNLSKLAEFLQPLIETQTQKDVAKSAIVMNLSRLQRLQKKVLPTLQEFKVENITVHSNLCINSFHKTPQVHNKVHEVYGQIQKQHGYITFTESVSEITVITENSFVADLKKNVPETPLREFTNIAAVGMKFHKKYVDAPGMIYFLIQQITMQNINILELSSTFTELIIYIDQKNSSLAFETIQNCFS